MASSFKIGERFREKARDLLEGESSVSEELREELKALTDLSIIPFNTARKLHKLLQENGKKPAHSIEQLHVLILLTHYKPSVLELQDIQCIFTNCLRTAHFIFQKLSHPRG